MKLQKPIKAGDVHLLTSFYRFIRPHKFWVMLAISFIPVTTGASVVIPWLLVHIVDNYIVTADASGLYLMIGLFAGAVFAGYVADGIYTFSLQKAGHLSISDMRSSLYDHTLKLPRSYFDRKPIGVTLSRLTSDMESIGESIAVGVLSLFTDMFKTVSLFIFLFYLSWKLTLVIIVVLPVVYLVVSFIRRRLRYFYNMAREALANASGYLQESLTGIKTVQLYVAENKVIERFKEKNRRFLKAQTRSNAYDAALFSIVDSLTSVTMALVIWYGTGQVLSGIITIGILIGFINTLSRIFIPIREFAQQIAMIQRALSALEHIQTLFNEKEEETELSPMGKMSGEDNIKEFVSLDFKNVTFSYPSSNETVLRDISFTLDRGEKIAIVGTTGSGKSTVLKLIAKHYENYSGEIRINENELRQIPRSSLNTLVTLMHQDVYLFNESLAFNISLNRKDIGEKEIWQAAEYVHAHEFIRQLPDKLNYQVTENGANLSAGQAQLVSFARAIAGKSELILLDEATSSVDSLTEALIQKAIERIFSRKTVIAVAHRLSTIRKSNRILVMKDGRIIEQGDHDSLVRKNGYYVDLLDSFKSTDSNSNKPPSPDVPHYSSPL